MSLEELKKNHALHGLALGAVVYYATKNQTYAFVSGTLATAYMIKYGHNLPPQVLPDQMLVSVDKETGIITTPSANSITPSVHYTRTSTGAIY